MNWSYEYDFYGNVIFIYLAIDLYFIKYDLTCSLEIWFVLFDLIYVVNVRVW